MPKMRNLTAYLTAPPMFRPARGTSRDDPPWYTDMVLQPSAWPGKSHPPRPANGFVQLEPFGGKGNLQVAVLHRALSTPPELSDFEACDVALRKVVSSSSTYTVNATDPHTPTFSMYYLRDDMPPISPGPFDFECWVVVVHQ